jgi:hypothetical protein
MAEGDDSGTGTGDTAGPDPITAPYDWGLGSAAVPGVAPGVASASPVDPASPIDALFGETQFKDYEDEAHVAPISTGLNPFAGDVGAAAADAPSRAVPVPDRAARTSFPKNRTLLLWAAGAAIALLVFAVLFAVGTRIGTAPVPGAASKSVAPSPVSSPSSSKSGPASPGVRLWSDLRGGECIDPYTNPFAQKFTVVDCAVPHPAQLVVRGTFPGEATAAWPGLDALQSQINQLCTTPGVINLTTAGAYNDIQFQAAYAATTDEWTNGQHDYFCVVNRSGGGPITGSVAGKSAK